MSEQVKFKILCSIMIWWQFWCILVYFDAFWWTLCTTLCPSPPLITLTPIPFSTVHLIQKWISVTWPNLKCFVLSCYGDHFSAFWCILMHLDALALTAIPFQVSIYSRNGSLRTNSKHFAPSWYNDYFGVFWCILLHFARPFTQLDDSSMTCSDCYTLSSAKLIQK